MFCLLRLVLLFFSRCQALAVFFALILTGICAGGWAYCVRALSYGACGLAFLEPWDGPFWQRLSISAITNGL